MLPRSILDGIYSPEHLPRIADLTDYIENDQTVSQKLEAEVDRLIEFPEPGSQGRMTEAQAKLVDQRIDAMISEIKETRERIAGIQKYIDDIGIGERIPNFSVDLTKKKNIKKAIQKTFNRKTNTITYEMYKEALQAKKLLESQEASAYTAVPPKTGGVIGNSSTGVDRVVGVASTASGGGSRIVEVAGTASGGGSR